MCMMAQLSLLILLCIPLLRSAVCNCAIGLFGILNMACIVPAVFLDDTKPYCGSPNQIPTCLIWIQFVCLRNTLGKNISRGLGQANTRATHLGKILVMYG